MMESRPIQTDLMIIGAGMAGMSAAVFAANRGIDTVLAGGAGSLDYASGLLDLWSMDGPRKYCTHPWEAIKNLDRTWPSHPFRHIKNSSIEIGLKELKDSLGDNGLAYTGSSSENTLVVTAFGTVKPSFLIPKTMKNNAAALKSRDPVLILDIEGLREFRAGFVSQVLKEQRPAISTASIVFPGMEGRLEVSTPLMAQAMETQQTQDKFVHALTPLVKSNKYLGLPAILGIHNSDAILARLEKMLGIKIFEIPTSPVSVPGIRLKETFKKALSPVCFLPNQLVGSGVHGPGTGFSLKTYNRAGTIGETVQAKTVLLATGRFLSKGLIADRKGVFEPLFGLPVHRVPKSRKDWHSKEYFESGEHLINQAGLCTDKDLRPVGKDNNPVYGTMYAAGSILCGQDWMQTRSGSGLSIATAFHAIEKIMAPGKS